MGPTATPTDGTPAAAFVHYLHVLRRRIWIFAVPVVVAPLAAFVLTVGQPASYQATTTVLLSNLNLAQSLNGLPADQSFSQQPDRALATQATIARSPSVAARAVRDARASMTADALLGSSSVAPANNANLLDFHVSNHDRVLAVALANAYALSFSRFSNELERAPLQTAFNDVTRTLNKLAAKKQQTSPLYRDLLDKQQRLAALQTLQTSNAVVVRSATGATQVAPRPKRAALLGLALGLLVALALVFAVEALDPRVRDEAEIESALHLPLLARIPAAPAPRAHTRVLAPALQYGGALQAEAFRMLRTNLAFAALTRDLRVLLVTSPRPGDGKTTTSANLALAAARGGQRVILCDLDGHNPALSEALGIPAGGAGVTEIVLGRASVADALTPVDIRGGGRADALAAYTAASSSASERRAAAAQSGRLDVLPFGSLHPPDPGEFVAADPVRALIEELRTRAELIIVDSAPILSVSDPLVLATHADATLLVIKATAAGRGDLKELARLLAGAQTPCVGFVLTDTRSSSAAYGYGYGYGGTTSDHLRLESAAQTAER
jgi:Mrp family chromosome partitioning ATPase/capsular polysaccharide biosynthesis protein